MGEWRNGEEESGWRDGKKACSAQRSDDGGRKRERLDDRRSPCTDLSRRDERTNEMEEAMLLSREEALAALKRHMKDEALLKHCYGVEAGMRGVALALGEDEELWALAGLLHDIDYEEHPDVHPRKGVEWLGSMGLPDELVHAVASHGSERTGAPRKSKLDWALWGVDELSGLVSATALVRPSKKLEEVKVKSVRKKMKDKSFARAVDRAAIREAAAALGVELSVFIAMVLEGMQEAHEELGL